MAEVEELKQQIESMNSTINHAHAFHDKLNTLHERGLIKEDDDGTFMIVDDLSEREQIREQISSKKKLPNMAPISSRRQAQNFGPEQILNFNDEDSSTTHQGKQPQISKSALD